MPVATRPRSFSSLLLPLLVAAASLVSGCQSSRPSFSFEPTLAKAERVDNAVLMATPLDSADATAKASAASPAPAAALARSKAQPKTRTARIAFVAKAALIPAIGRAAVPRRRALLHRSQGKAEVGLGTTVLGVLGLIVLPIALIGLAISGGGLVWAIIAGAAALAVLVAYIDPFGR